MAKFDYPPLSPPLSASSQFADKAIQSCFVFFLGENLMDFDRLCPGHSHRQTVLSLDYLRFANHLSGLLLAKNLFANYLINFYFWFVVISFKKVKFQHFAIFSSEPNQIRPN